MRLRGIRVEARIIGQIKGIDPIGKYLCCDIVELMTDNESFEFTMELIGQRTSFCEQFKADVGNNSVFYFAIYK